MKYKFYIVIALVAFTSCTGNKKQGGANTPADTVVTKENFDSIVTSQTRADTDTVYKNSEAYRYAQENYHRRIAEQTKGMTHAGQILYEYEMTLNTIKATEQGLKNNPKLMNENNTRRKLSMLGHQAQQIYDQLNAMKLSPQEKLKFQQLNKNK